MSSKKGEIRKFHILVVPRRQGNVQKCWMHMHTYCFPNPNQLSFFFVILIAAVLLSLEPLSSHLNKMSHEKSLSSVDSDKSEWNLNLRFVPNIQKNFQEVANYDPMFFS